MMIELGYSTLAILFVISVIQLARETKYEKWILLTITSIYIGYVIFVTLISGARGGGSGVIFRFPLPFYRAIKSGHYGLTTNRSVLNLLLFIPFGYLLPQLIKRWNPSLLKTTLFGFMASLLIEIIQLVFHRGVFEMDDLVKNTFGATMGCAIWRIMNRSHKQPKTGGADSASS